MSEQVKELQEEIQKYKKVQSGINETLLQCIKYQEKSIESLHEMIKNLQDKNL